MRTTNVNHGSNETSKYGNCVILCGSKGISLTCETTRAFSEQHVCFAKDTRVMRTLTDITSTMPKTKRLTLCELRNIAKELKNADFGVIQEVVVREVQKEKHVHFSPRVPLLVGMSLLLLAALARLSGVSGILRSRFPPIADPASIADRLLRFCCASNSGVRSEGHAA